MTFVCGISGEWPEHPAVTKYGHVYESSVIEKYVQEQGKDPITDLPLTPQDIIPIHISPLSSTSTSNSNMEKQQAVRGFVKPRCPSSTSIPAMLKSFQDEWDATMLEMFELREQLQKSRQELSHALYQHDAACRVIARLTKERDEAKSALVYIQQQNGMDVASGSASTGAAAASSSPSKKRKLSASSSPVKKSKEGVPQKEEEQKAGGELPAGVVEEMNSTAVRLSKGRKKRPKPEGFPDSNTLATLNSNNNGKKKEFEVSFTPKGQNGVFQLGCSSLSDTTIVLGGGSSSDAVVLDRNSGAVQTTLKGHKKPISAVLIIGGKEEDDKLVVTGSHDGSIKIWNLAGAKKVLKTAEVTIDKVHSGAVTALCLHACGKYILSSSADGSWAMHELENGELVCKVDAATKAEGGLTKCAIHPDGLVFATGDAAGNVQVWDVKGQANVLTFDSEKDGDSVTGLAFSENGIYLASGNKSGSLKMHDLRKLSTVKTVDTEMELNSLRFDTYGAYIAVVGSDVKLYQANKQLDAITSVSGSAIKNGKESGVFTDVCFSQSGREVITCTAKGHVKVLGVSE
eukprot:Nk52_evm22s152 gene=Nk52_evmTU22s152